MKDAELKQSIKQLETYCQKNNMRFTKPRQSVLTLILRAEKPITAYEIIDHLKHELDNPKPPTIYRALDFLKENAFIHRIESLNAYISCIEGHRHKGSQFMICDNCQCVEEIHLCHLPPALEKKIEETRFQINYWNIEVHGVCLSCQQRA